MIYDIRTQANAEKTLEEISGVTVEEWQKYIETNSNETDENIIVANMKCNYSLSEISVYLTHLTTAMNIDNIKKYGLLDLREAYRNRNTDLRRFLDSKGITIDLDRALLSFKDRIFNIDFKKQSQKDRYNQTNKFLVARRFDYDKEVCGFLSLDNYSGNEDYHIRPEILKDLDALLKTNLSREWAANSKPKEILFCVNADEILLDSSNKDPIVQLILEAYNKAFSNFIICSEILIKKDCKITGDRILEINDFDITKYKK
ncbi:MAG: hypothetical protein MJ146_02190 [Clostridia bacterium]|nr:hypothetical protein [Clostridia bacterium]